MSSSSSTISFARTMFFIFFFSMIVNVYGGTIGSKSSPPPSPPPVTPKPPPSTPSTPTGLTYDSTSYSWHANSPVNILPTVTFSDGSRKQSPYTGTTLTTGQTTYIFSINNNVILPNGLQLDAKTGIILGTPTFKSSSSSYTIGLKTSTTTISSFTFTIVITPALPLPLSSNSIVASFTDTPGGYNYFNWPSTTQSRTYEDYFVQVQTDPGVTSNVFWSFQTGSGGPTAYMGLQTDLLTAKDANPDYNGTDTIGKLFLFSTWGTGLQARNGSPGSWCVVSPTVADGSAGGGCRILYPWIAGRSYRFRFQDEGSNWYSSTVSEMLNGNVINSFQIGSFNFGTTVKPLADHGMWVSFVEYWEWSMGGTHCGNFPHSKATTNAQTIIGGSTIASTVSNDNNPDNKCTSYIKNSVTGSKGTQEIGVGNTIRGQFRLGNNCLSVSSLSDNSLVNLSPCAGMDVVSNFVPRNVVGGDGQFWVYANDGSIRLKLGYCLTVLDGFQLKEGSNVGILLCVINGTLSQQWQIDTSGKIRTALEPDLCLNGSSLIRCSSASSWITPLTVASPVSKDLFRVQLKSDINSCLIQNLISSTQAQNSLSLSYTTCSNNLNMWSFSNSLKTISTSSLCITSLSGVLPQIDDKVTVQTCNGSSYQQWQIMSDGTIALNSDSQLCLAKNWRPNNVELVLSYCSISPSWMIQ
jgi:hypothetical protein